MSDELLLEPDAKTFDQAINRLIANGDDTGLLDLFARLPTIVEQLREASGEERFDSPIPVMNVCAAAAVALRRGKRGAVQSALDALVKAYRLGDVTSIAGTPDDLRLWEAAMSLWALGAVAVEMQDWSVVRWIVADTPVEEGHYATWLRHGQVMQARSAADAADDNILDLSVARLGTSPSFGMESRSKVEREALVCAFDQLALLVTRSLPDAGDFDYYPSYAKFPATYVEPCVIELRQRTEMRAAIFDGQDSDLRDVLRDANEAALLQAAQYRYLGRNWRYEGFQDARTWTFIRAGHIHEEWGAPPQPVSFKQA